MCVCLQRSRGVSGTSSGTSSKGGALEGLSRGVSASSDGAIDGGAGLDLHAVGGVSAPRDGTGVNLFPALGVTSDGVLWTPADLDHCWTTADL